MSSVCCPTCGTSIPAPRFRYGTQEERDAARLRTYRRSSRKRYQEYVALREQYGAPHREPWTAHLRELRHSPRCSPPGLAAKPVKAVKPVVPDYDFWLEKVAVGELTMDQIRGIGSGLTMFDVSSDAPAAEGLLEQEVVARW